MEEYIIRSIEHSMRSMFLMVAVVRDSTGQCFILDHNKELENISAGRKDEGGDNFAKRKLTDPQKGDRTGTNWFVPEHTIPAGSVHTLFKSLKKNIHPEDREAFARFTDHDAYVKELEDHIFVSVELRIRHADRKYYWSELILCNTTEEDSTEPGQFSEKVERGISEYNESHSNPYSVGASYGWVLLPAKEGMTGLDEYIEMADAKMYEMRMERDKYRRD